MSSELHVIPKTERFKPEESSKKGNTSEERDALHTVFEELRVGGKTEEQINLLLNRLNNALRESNGVISIGDSINDELLTEDKDKLYTKGSWTNILGNIPITHNIQESLLSIVYCTALYLLGYPGRLDMNNCICREAPAAKQINEKHFIDYEKNAAYGMKIIEASKVNYWSTGHHTGTTNTTVQGYLRKQLEALNITDLQADDITLIWRMAHWASTRNFLTRMGVPGLLLDKRDKSGNETNVDIKVAIPTPTETSVLRVADKPAGLAKIIDAYNAMKECSVGACKSMVSRPLWSEHNALGRFVSKYPNKRARFHKGARYLTGEEPIRLPAVTESYLECAKAFLMVSRKKQGLANAPSLSNVNPPIEVIERFKGVIEHVNKSIANKLADDKEFINSIIGDIRLNVSAIEPNMDILTPCIDELER